MAPAGSAHFRCFGAQNKHMDPEADIGLTKHAVSSFFSPVHYNGKRVEIERVVFPNWSKGELAAGCMVLLAR